MPQHTCIAYNKAYVSVHVRALPLTWRRCQSAIALPGADQVLCL